MISRREWLELSLGASAAALVAKRFPDLAKGFTTAPLRADLITRAIPSSGEKLPIVGLGTADTYSQAARAEEVAAVKAIIKALVDGGGTVVDSAPSYGASEDVTGRLAAELGLTNKIFWATKVNVVQGRGGGGGADPAAARAQIEASFSRFKVPKMDCIQVHNLADVPTQLGILKEYKQQGKVRYIGVTTTNDGQYTQLEQIMRSEPIDFIGVDYAIDNRNVEQTILPLAIEKKIAVLVYLPFGRRRVLPRLAGKPLPGWAEEFGITSWAQFMLKWIVANPAVTVATPGTSKPEHMVDNLKAAVGKLPDDAARKKMSDLIDALPPA